MNKLIFLDIDGVMNHQNHFVRSTVHEGQEFCPVAVKNLHEIMERTGAKIVVSSTWRLAGITRIRKIFRCYNLHRDVVGLTPVMDDEERGVEIEKFLQEYGKTHSIKSFVIIDDDDDMGELLPYLVQTSHYQNGLNDEKRDEVIEKLLFTK